MWILVAVVAGVLIPEVEERIDSGLSDFVTGLLFGGGADAARTVLSAIAGSLITATSLTFSLTVVALQLASSQASPRLLRLFASDRMVHATMSVFLGTFAYALTVLRTVRSETPTEPEQVPQIAVTLASLLTLASVIMLALFLAHLARQLRVETMLKNVNEETARVIERMPDPQPEHAAGAKALDRPSVAVRVTAQKSGFLVSLDRTSLVEVAQRFDLGIAEEVPLGSSVIMGSPLAYWWPLGTDPDEDARSEIQDCIVRAHDLEYERTAAEDVGFGLRQLADVALKAVSPGVNDPTTAVHALSHASAILCLLVGRPAESAVLADEDGAPRLLRKTMDVPALIELVLGQLRHYGTSDPDVAARMLQLLRELGFANRRADLDPEIRQQLERLTTRIREQPFDAVELDRLERLRTAALTALSGAWPPDGAAGALLSKARLKESGTPST